MSSFRELGKKANLTQEELIAQFNARYNKKYSAAAISKFEHDKRIPATESLKDFAEFFGVSVDYLLGMPEREPAPAGRPAASASARKKGVRIPVLGRVVAGIPIEAVQEYDDWEEIPEEMARRGEYFALRVTGDSMKPVICNGDIIIVRIQPDVDTEQIAVVGVNGNEATVKKIIKDPHRHGIILYGYNAEVYQPTFYSEEEIETLPVTIYGLVVEARHKFI